MVLYMLSGTYKSFWYLLSACSVALDNSGAHNNCALVQYIPDGPEVEVKVKPHGNSKQSTPYFRTSESARKAIKKVALSLTLKPAVDQLTRDLGGEMEVHPSSLPRNRQQISNVRREKVTKDKNVLHSVMVECKLAQRGNAFVHDGKAAPYPQCVLSLIGSCMTWLDF